MSKSHVHLYGLVALLCVSMVMSQESAGTISTNSSSVGTTPSPSQTTTNITTTDISTGNYNDQNVTSHHDYDANSSNSSLTPTDTPISQDGGLNETVAAPTANDSNSTSKADAETSESHATVPVIINTSTAGAGSKSPEHSSIGVVFLVLILLIIIALAVLLYILWKKGRTYSFDLSHVANDHDTPLRSMEHGGTFECTSKELPTLDFDQEDKSQETSPTANGCAGETDKQAASSEQQNVPEEDSFMSDASLTPPPKKVDFCLDLDLIGGDFEVLDPPSPEASDQQQNENNNNVTNSGNNGLDLFTEINLDEPQ
ncbi:uncharacterized protein [Salminus brasiliensis]|uniref:uncharacterized protein n=1 Tax=Salminus brasiliensis TaxID=930266 RepID=UPI003B82FA42